jgi:predicted RNA-binding Zn ribbon-like protein
MPSEPIAVAFANTRSSSQRDRIETLAQWRTWIGAWPGLRMAGHAVDADGLQTLRAIRDDIQLLLRGRSGRNGPQRDATARLLAVARSASNLDLRWRQGLPTLAIPADATPATAIAQHLARAALDLLLTGPQVVPCEGHDCLKVVLASRSDRRWCDSAICGNRARVRSHHRRQAGGWESVTSEES